MRRATTKAALSLSTVARSKGSPLFLATAIRTAYSERVLDHYHKPRNVGSLDSNSPDVGTGICGAPECGDLMKMQIEVDDSGVIRKAKFKTFGCGSALASSSLATEKIIGMHYEEALQLTNKEIAAELTLPPVKLHCSMLAEETIHAAVKDILAKKPMLVKTRVVPKRRSADAASSAHEPTNTSTHAEEKTVHGRM